MLVTPWSLMPQGMMPLEVGEIGVGVERETVTADTPTG